MVPCRGSRAVCKRTDAVNLLQGEFARSTDYNARWLRWRTAAMLAGGLLVAHVAAAMIRIHQANHETQSLDTQISQIFQQVMPSEKMQDPRRQMQSRLDRIRHSGAGPEYFLHALEVLEQRASAGAEHAHRFAQLSRAGSRLACDGAQPHARCRSSLSR